MPCQRTEPENLSTHNRVAIHPVFPRKDIHLCPGLGLPGMQNVPYFRYSH